MNVKQELLKGLSEEQLIKVKECANSSDLLQLAKDEGVELSDEQLMAVTGGGCSGDDDEDDKKNDDRRKFES